MQDKTSQHWQLLFQQSPLGVIEWDTNWRVASWNPVAEKIFEWKASEAIGQHYEFIVPRSAKNHVAIVTADLTNQRGGTRSSNLNITKSGKLVHCEWFNTTLKNNLGETVGAASIVQDVSSQLESQRRVLEYSHRLSDINTQLRKLAQNQSFHKENLESALREITEVASLGLNVSRVTVWSFEREQQEARCVLSFDKNTETYTTEKSLLIREFPIFFKALDEERIIAAHDARLDYRTAEFTKEYFLPSNIFSKMAVGTRLRGELVGMICFEHSSRKRVWSPEEQIFATAIADLVSLALESSERQKAESAKKRLEAELFQKHKLEALGTLAGGIAHDFNNILAVIMGSTELALIRAKDRQFPMEELNRIGTAALRAKDLVTQILLFSKSQPIELRPVRLQDLVYDSLKLIRATFPSSIEVIEKLNVPDAIIDSHPTFIYQLLLNICTNGVHACENGRGTIEIALNKSTSSLGKSNQRKESVTLSISDSGSGIEPHILSHIFDPFFTTKDPGKGTGLGLSVVHSIVDTLGGRITVKSESGAGTTFSIELPISTNAPNRGKISGVTFGKGENILLVDDEVDVLESTSQLLEHLGYHVTAYSDPLKALEDYRKNHSRYALVVTDITMPQIDGAQLAEQMLKIDNKARFLFVSGFGFEINMNALPKASLLQKPIELSALSEGVQSAIRN